MSVENTRVFYERLVNPINTVITDCIMESTDPKDYIPKEYLWNVLRKYCKEKHLQMPTSKKQIAYALKRNFESIGTGKRVADKPQTYVWLNCKFKDPEMQKEFDEWFFKVTDGKLESERPQFELENAFAD